MSWHHASRYSVSRFDSVSDSRRAGKGEVEEAGTCEFNFGI